MWSTFQRYTPQANKQHALLPQLNRHQQCCVMATARNQSLCCIQEWSGRAPFGTCPASRTAPVGGSTYCFAAARGRAALAASSPGYPIVAVVGHLQGTVFATALQAYVEVHHACTLLQFELNGALMLPVYLLSIPTYICSHAVHSGGYEHQLHQQVMTHMIQ